MLSSSKRILRQKSEAASYQVPYLYLGGRSGKSLISTMPATNPPYVRPDRDSAAGLAGVANRGGTDEELHQEPIAQHDPGRQPPEGEKNDQRNQGQHPRPRI